MLISSITSVSNIYLLLKLFLSSTHYFPKTPTYSNSTIKHKRNTLYLFEKTLLLSVVIWLIKAFHLINQLSVCLLTYFRLVNFKFRHIIITITQTHEYLRFITHIHAKNYKLYRKTFLVIKLSFAVSSLAYLISHCDRKVIIKLKEKKMLTKKRKEQKVIKKTLKQRITCNYT